MAVYNVRVSVVSLVNAKSEEQALEVLTKHINTFEHLAVFECADNDAYESEDQSEEATASAL